MSMLLLLAIVTLAYVGYNLLIKVSGDHVPADATTTVFAAICLQTGALATSAIFAAILAFQGGQTFRLTAPSYAWALAAGLCIGIAEIGYLTIFGRSDPLPASVVIPTVVTGTVVVTLIVSVFAFGERLGTMQLAGAAMIVGGIIFMFVGRTGSA